MTESASTSQQPIDPKKNIQLGSDEVLRMVDRDHLIRMKVRDSVFRAFFGDNEKNIPDDITRSPEEIQDFMDAVEDQIVATVKPYLEKNPHLIEEFEIGFFDKVHTQEEIQDTLHGGSGFCVFDGKSLNDLIAQGKSINFNFPDSKTQFYLGKVIVPNAGNQHVITFDDRELRDQLNSNNGDIIVSGAAAVTQYTAEEVANDHRNGLENITKLVEKEKGSHQGDFVRSEFDVIQSSLKSDLTGPGTHFLVEWLSKYALWKTAEIMHYHETPRMLRVLDGGVNHSVMVAGGEGWKDGKFKFTILGKDDHVIFNPHVVHAFNPIMPKQYAKLYGKSEEEYKKFRNSINASFLSLHGGSKVTAELEMATMNQKEDTKFLDAKHELLIASENASHKRIYKLIMGRSFGIGATNGILDGAITFENVADAIEIVEKKKEQIKNFDFQEIIKFGGFQECQAEDARKSILESLTKSRQFLLLGLIITNPEISALYGKRISDNYIFWVAVSHGDHERIEEIFEDILKDDSHSINLRDMYALKKGVEKTIANIEKFFTKIKKDFGYLSEEMEGIKESLLESYRKTLHIVEKLAIDNREKLIKELVSYDNSNSKIYGDSEDADKLKNNDLIKIVRSGDSEALQKFLDKNNGGLSLEILNNALEITQKLKDNLELINDFEPELNISSEEITEAKVLLSEEYDDISSSLKLAIAIEKENTSSSRNVTSSAYTAQTSDDTTVAGEYGIRSSIVGLPIGMPKERRSRSLTTLRGLNYYGSTGTSLSQATIRSDEEEGDDSPEGIKLRGSPSATHAVPYNTGSGTNHQSGRRLFSPSSAGPVLSTVDDSLATPLIPKSSSVGPIPNSTTILRGSQNAVARGDSGNIVKE